MLKAQKARNYLDANLWNLEAAAAEFYHSQEEANARGEGDESSSESENLSPAQPITSTGRTLGGNPTPQPIPTTSSIPPPPKRGTKEPPKKKFATLGDLSGGGGSSHAGHGHDDDDDDGEDQDFFAGGEKSGLAVQNPDEMKRKILERARK